MRAWEWWGLAFQALTLTCGRRVSEPRKLRMKVINDRGGQKRDAVTVCWQHTESHSERTDNLVSMEGIARLQHRHTRNPWERRGEPGAVSLIAIRNSEICFSIQLWIGLVQPAIEVKERKPTVEKSEEEFERGPRETVRLQNT